MERLPKIIVENVLIGASVQAYGEPVASNAYQTINSAVATNTSDTAQPLDIFLVPAADEPGESSRVVAAMIIPSVGAAPTVLSPLVGQHLMQGGQVYAKAGAAGAINLRISGYEITR